MWYYPSRLVFSCCFEDTDISQGSVSTHLMCGGIFSDSTIKTFLQTLRVKKFEHCSIGLVDEVIRRAKMCHILDHPVGLQDMDTDA